jgi:hypothetical protein
MTSRATRARTGVVGTYTLRSSALPPATGASSDLFSIDGGAVMLLGFYGHVDVALPNTVISFDLAHDPDDATSDVVLATATSVQNKAVNTWTTLNTTAGGALVVSSINASYGVRLATPIVLDIGNIKVNTTGGGAIGTTARVSWGALWVPVVDAGTLTAV